MVEILGDLAARQEIVPTACFLQFIYALALICARCIRGENKRSEGNNHGDMGMI